MTGRRTEILLLQAPLYWDIYVPLGLDSARLAFTCHNFEYQGSEPAGALCFMWLKCAVAAAARPHAGQFISQNNKPSQGCVL